MDSKSLQEIKQKLQTVTIQEKSSVVNLKAEEKNKQLLEQNNFDKWYDALKSELIPSHVFMISNAEARALARCYEHSQMGKESLTTQEQGLLDELSVKIEKEATVISGDILKKGFFVRMTTRSPKDSRIFSDEMFADIKAECDKCAAKGVTVDDNLKLNIIYVLFVKKMIVYSGKEAIKILGESHRIWQDICSSLDVGSPLGIVIRQWADIHPSMEFRGFVYDRKLNAISSYNRAVSWPGIPERIKEIEEKCKAYYEKIQPKIPLSMQNFIVDFAFLADGTVTIVEFNDFADFEGCGANAELFNWETDKEILQGKKPFETRVVMKPLEREALGKTLTKPFKIHLGWVPKESWVPGVDWY